MINAHHISYQIKEVAILKNTSIYFDPGKFHVIMGANGAGKSTLLKLLADDIKPSSGGISYGEKDLRKFDKLELARKRAVLSQQYLLNFPITVEEIVLMGRYPYFATKPSTSDLDICQRCMQIMEVAHFADRDYNTLSGGEAQKVQMSRVLAQIWTDEPQADKVLFLDEPVSHLDVKYQHQLLSVARQLCGKGITVIAILHDLNLALTYGDRILFMKRGEVIRDLADPSCIDTTIIEETFGIAGRLINDPAHARPIVIF